eukprot:1626702-Pleurochrysis_carterae.AAC.2
MPRSLDTEFLIMVVVCGLTRSTITAKMFSWQASMFRIHFIPLVLKRHNGQPLVSKMGKAAKCSGY